MVVPELPHCTVSPGARSPSQPRPSMQRASSSREISIPICRKARTVRELSSPPERFKIRLRPRATEAKITARCAMDLSPGTEIVPHRGLLTGSIRLITFTSRNQRASFIGSSEITLQQRPFSVPNPAIEALEIFDVIGE